MKSEIIIGKTFYFLLDCSHMRKVPTFWKGGLAWPSPIMSFLYLLEKLLASIPSSMCCMTQYVEQDTQKEYWILELNKLLKLISEPSNKFGISLKDNITWAPNPWPIHFHANCDSGIHAWNVHSYRIWDFCKQMLSTFPTALSKGFFLYHTAEIGSWQYHL